LTDGVVTLRVPDERDVDSLVSACSDPDIIRFTRVPTPYRRTDGEAFIRQSREGFARGDAFAFVIATASTDDLAGTILLGIHGQGVGEVGYWVRKEDRGLGYASRATRLLAEWGIRALGLVRVELHAFPENVASQRVAEKVGFQREGLLRSYREIRNERRDMVVYSLIAADIGE
jgi:RimJ/RimL family protein N-acetyltransferase